MREKLHSVKYKKKKNRFSHTISAKCWKHYRDKCIVKNVHVCNIESNIFQTWRILQFLAALYHAVIYISKKRILIELKCITVHAIQLSQ